MTPDSKNNDDIKQHLLNIEARLDRLSVSPQLSFDSLSARSDDEIDLREIWNILWKGKWWIIGITALFAVAAVIYALSLPNQYKAEVVLAPAQEKAGGMSGLAAQYGGLAAMAGINLGAGRNTSIDQATVLVKSWAFLDALVEKYELRPLIMAVKGYDELSGQVIFDSNIYNPETKRWLRPSASDRPKEPTSYEVYEVFSRMISVSHDAKTGLIRLSVEHYVPHFSHEWVGLLVAEVNRHFQSRDILEANQNIDYLRAKIRETSIADMHSVFYRMIEGQMKTLMLAEVSEEYLVKTVVPVKVPEKKSSPSRGAICLVGVVLGIMISLCVLVGRYISRKDGNDNEGDSRHYLARNS